MDNFLADIDSLKVYVTISSITTNRVIDQNEYSVAEFIDDPEEVYQALSEYLCNYYYRTTTYQQYLDSVQDVSIRFDFHEAKIIDNEEIIEPESHSLTVLSNKIVIADQHDYEYFMELVWDLVDKTSDSSIPVDLERVEPADFDLETYKQELISKGVNDFLYHGYENISQILEAVTDYRDREAGKTRGRPPFHGFRYFLQIQGSYGKEICKVFHSNGNVSLAHCAGTPLEALEKPLSEGLDIRVCNEKGVKYSTTLYELCNDCDFDRPFEYGRLYIKGHEIGTIYTHFEDSRVTFSKDISEETFNAYVTENSKYQAVSWSEEAVALSQKFNIELPEVGIHYPTVR